MSMSNREDGKRAEASGKPDARDARTGLTSPVTDQAVTGLAVIELAVTRLVGLVAVFACADFSLDIACDVFVVSRSYEEKSAKAR